MSNRKPKPSSKPKPVARRRRANNRALTIPRPLLDSHARSYAALLQNPGIAQLVHSTYEGPMGTIQRYVRQGTVTSIGGAGGNLLIMYQPNTNSLRINTNDFTGPGASILGSVATGMRVIAAELEVSYTGTELNRGGACAFGNISTNYGWQPLVVTIGGASKNVLIDNSGGAINLSTFLPHRERVTNKVTVKFVPGAADHFYSDFQGADALGPRFYAPSSLETNTIAFSATDLPVADVPFQYRITSVVEFLSQGGTGVVPVAASTPKSSVNTTHQVVSEMHKANPFWHSVSSSFLKTGGERLGNLAANTAGYVATRATASYLADALPMALSIV